MNVSNNISEINFPCELSILMQLLEYIKDFLSINSAKSLNISIKSLF